MTHTESEALSYARPATAGAPQVPREQDAMDMERSASNDQSQG